MQDQTSHSSLLLMPPCPDVAHACPETFDLFIKNNLLNVSLTSNVYLAQ